jgi:hypothetical protein
MDHPMAGTDFRRLLLVAGVASLLASYTLIWLRFVHDPSERTSLDFIAFYAAGRAARLHGDACVYDLQRQQEIEQTLVGVPLGPGQVQLYLHMPFLIPVLRLIMSADYVASFYRWLSLLIVSYVIGIVILSRSFPQTGPDRDSILAPATSTFLFLPVFVSLMTGQDTALLFVGVALWIHGLFSGRELLSGMGLTLATVRPHVALVLALPMLFRYPRTFVGFTIGSGTLALISLWILGIEGTQQFINILVLSAGGRWYGTNENAMYNLIGLLSRGAPGLTPELVHITGWLAYGFAILGLCALWARSSDAKAWLIGPSVALALLAAPHLHFHDLALLLFPIYECMRSSKQDLKTFTAIALPIAISLLLLVSNVSPGLRYKVPYLVLLLLAAYPCSARFKPLLRGAA